MKKSTTTIAIAVAALVIAAAVWGAGSAVESAYARGLAVGRSQSHAALKAQFDKGMKAGVDYETWFCANPEQASQLGQSGQ